MLELLSAAVGLVAAIALTTFLRAYSAKRATGKWPHQCPKSHEVFRSIP